VNALLALANGAALHKALSRQKLGVSYRTVARWVGEHPDAKPPPAVVPHILKAFGIPETEKEALRPEWAEGLLREVRLNRAVIQAAFAVGDPGFVQRVMDRLASLEEPPTPRGDEAHAGAGAAT